MTDESLSSLVQALWPDIQPTPLYDAKALASDLGLGGLYVKLEAGRPLGNFKSLGGMTAAIRLLMRETGCKTLEAIKSFRNLPALTCASDGNHGLAIAAAAKRVGARATIFLPDHVSGDRVDRIAREGATIERVAGTYDDAVDMAKGFASETGALLVPDTSDLEDDEGVALVMEGYGIMTGELVQQIASLTSAPTHLFIQAGVGGLAAAVAKQLTPIMAPPALIIVVEPQTADCVGQALKVGRIERLTGSLETGADMLSCGEASAPAIEELMKHNVTSLVLNEADLDLGPDLASTIRAQTSVSGAAGLAGLVKACGDNALRLALNLSATSTVLIVLTESQPPVSSTEACALLGT